MHDELLDPAAGAYELVTASPGPAGALPLTPEQLRHAPSGDLFGWSQNAGMGLDPRLLGRPEFLILSTAGGLRAADGSPVALGYHTGHWEVALQVREAAEEVRAGGGVPFAGAVTDPCDGRTQGTPGMFDSLPYRNDAAMVLRRLIRSLPTRAGVLGIATCDKGLPAMMMALAGCGDRPAVLVPGGVMLAGTDQEDTAKVQSIGARYAAGRLTLEEAAEQGCRTCASPGGGCQFLGTAATSQVVAEALGLTLPHAALAPSGQPVWLDLARRSARALMSASSPLREVLSADSVENAMVVHAAFGGSTNLLIHIPAVAFAAALPRPTVADWTRVNRAVPRLVDALPNGPVGHPTVRVFLAGGVPEVMLHLRDLGLLKLTARTVAGQTLEQVLAWWERSEPRKKFRELQASRDGIDPDDVILPPARARERGLTPTACFPTGNLAPEGSVIKATAIDPAVVDADGVYRHEGPARVFTREADAVAAIKTGRVVAGDVLVLAGVGPLGTGMEETYQVTSALRYLPWGRHVAVLTDARFSGVSTGACIGHVSPEALAGGPLGRLRDGDRVRIVIDRLNLTGTVDYIGDDDLSQRLPHPGLAPDPRLPADTRLWAALQNASGGVWAGCVYDPDRIAERLAVS
jgi:putative YjhG/YagF family dehydratase